MTLHPSYLDPAVLDQLPNLEFVARCVVEGMYAGMHGSLYRGLSTEYSNHREYFAGDEIKFVDWKVFGRTDRLYIKQFFQEANMPVFLLLDSSASMGYQGGAAVTKLAYGSYLTAAFAYLLLKQADRVGLVLFGESIRSYLSPATKRSQLHALLAQLAGNEASGLTNVADSLVACVPLFKQRGMVIVISDLIEEEASVIEAVARLKHRGHDVLIVQVLDPRECTLDYKGFVRLKDIESDHELEMHVPTVRRAYLKRVSDYLQSLKQGILGLGVDYVFCDTSEPLTHAFQAILQQRRRL